MKTTLEFHPYNKHPLHLLLRESPSALPAHVQRQVDETWANRPKSDFESDRCVVKKTIEMDGRLLHIMKTVPYSQIFAWKQHNVLRQQPFIQKQEQKPAIIPELGPFTFANPLAKLVLPPSPDHSRGQTGLGRMRESGELTALGGFIDVDDFKKLQLPNGDQPVVPFLPDGRVDMKRIQAMVKAMDEAEEQGLTPNTPGIECAIREGYEEGGIPSKVKQPPSGEWRLVHTTPFGQKIMLEHWPIYDLYPENTHNLDQQFEAYDQRQQQEGGERELLGLIWVDNKPEALRTLLNNQDSRRPSVNPVIEAELRRQHAYDRAFGYTFDSNRLAVLLPSIGEKPASSGYSLTHRAQQTLTKAAREQGPSPWRPASTRMHHLRVRE